MKSCYTLLLLFLLGCLNNTKDKVQIDDLPWYISMPDSVLTNFNTRDSLDMYSDYFNPKKTINPKIVCYLADLEYSNGNIETARQLINRSLQENLDQTVENYLIPIYKYLVLDKPHRLYSIPPILIRDFKHYVALCHKYISSQYSGILYIGDFHFLSLKKINILDQWYRTPNREYIPDLQIEYDSVCQSIMDAEFYTMDLSTVDNSRDIIYTVILHAKDCNWAEKWIIKYADDFQNDKFIKSHLNHFLYRSDCRDIARIRESVEARLKQLKK